MKRIITLTLAVLLLLTLASCGKKEAEPTETTTPPVPTTEATEPPAPTEPEWEPGISRAAYGEAIFDRMDAKTEVNVLGQFKDYYVIEGEEVDLLVEKRFVRLDSEEPFVIWEGYAKYKTEVFDNVYLKGEPIATLTTNTKVKVLEGKDNWLYIQWADGEGYVHVEKISKWFIRSKKSEGGGGGGGSSSSGGSSGAADGTNVPIGSLTSAKDFNAQLHLLGAYYGPEMEKDFEPGKGMILAKDTEVYITLLLRDDEAKVTAYDEETITIWLEDDLYAQLPRWLLRLEGDEEYKSWTGYSRWQGVIYEEYQMRNELVTLNTNKKVTVLDELPDCYVVEYEDQIGYMLLDKVSEKMITTKKSSGDVGGGGGGGGSSGGGSGATWTPPLM